MKKYLIKVLFDDNDTYLCDYFTNFESMVLWLRQFKYNMVNEVIIKDITDNNSVKPLKLNFDEK